MNDPKIAKTALDRNVKNDSIRSTFYLSEGTLNKIEQMKKENNLKTKDLFDSICLTENIVKIAIGFGKDLKSDAKIYNNPRNKTFVISKKAYKTLNKIAEDNKLSRNKKACEYRLFNGYRWSC